MKERPILFNGEMVRAILDGRKTQTRRPVNPQPRVVHAIHSDGSITSNQIFRRGDQRIHSPFGTVGDRLWVRETTCIAPKRFATPDDNCLTDSDGDKRYVSYKADGHSEEGMRAYNLNWTPSIHVPRWASRITLEIVAVRVERMQDITENDAKAEGCRLWGEDSDPYLWFRDLWQSIYGNWDANPWVWVYEFRRVKP